MNTSTKSKTRFEEITFYLTELRNNCAAVESNQSCQRLLTSAIEYSKSAAEDTQSREMLLATLADLLRLEEDTVVANGAVVGITMRVLSLLYRALGRFDQAEILDRLEPKHCVRTLALLASDIRAQNQASRNIEVVYIYRKALEAGFKELKHSGVPSNICPEIAAVYFALADVLFEMDLVKEAELEIENLARFHEQAVAVHKIVNGVEDEIINAFKLILSMSREYTIRGLLPLAARMLRLAEHLLSHVVTHSIF